MVVDDLSLLKDDMVAFIAGHGLRRMTAYVPEDVATVLFESDDPDGWKDFVEDAKAAQAPFVTMSEVTLEPEDVATLIGQVRNGEFQDSDTMGLADAQDLLQHAGKVGYLQLGFAHGGVVFLYEAATDWYDQFQQLMESVTGIGGIIAEDDD